MAAWSVSIIPLGIGCNITSTVGVVLLNKYLYDIYEFHFMIFLSMLHFITTSIATRILLRIHFFQYKKATFQQVLPVALGSLGSVSFMNLNLAYNSVGFYQVSKLMCIPCTLALQFFLYGKSVSRRIQMTLIVILIGVGFATVSDMSVNQRGLVFATAAVLFTAFGQIFTGSKQKDLGLDAMQLLHHSSPIIATGMIPLCLLFDDIQQLRVYKPVVPQIFLVTITCVLAVGVNMSNYLVIGKTSPVTYQVVGHSKTCLILILGFLFFGSKCTLKIAAGILIAMIGVVMYGDVKRSELKQSTHTSTKLPMYKKVLSDEPNSLDPAKD